MIEILCRDITILKLDAIVNAANNSLLGGAGVDGAIHRGAGPELLAYNRTLGGCETGQAKLAPGFNLPAKHIIQTVGPVWQGGHQGESDLLESCYIESFQLAKAIGARAIAFPCISTGVYGFPKEPAARIALKTMRQYESDFDRIVACCFAEEDAALYRSLRDA